MNLNRTIVSLLLIFSVCFNISLQAVSRSTLASLSLGLMIGNTNRMSSCESRKIIAGLCTCCSIIGAGMLAYKSKNQELKTSAKAWLIGYFAGLIIRD